jgi:hypothetical protein
VATRFDTTLQMSNSTDALFQAWTQFIHNTLITTGGWVDPGDTGQVNLATAAHPTLANTTVGFRVYRMADALQATAPVYLRLDYGSSGAANSPRCLVTIGTGTNGAGTITGAIISGTLWAGNGNAVTACHSYGSADTNRVQLMMFVNGGAVDLMMMSIERSKDATGADTGAGILMTWGNNGQIVFTNFLIRAGGSQPPTEPGIAVVLSNVSGSTVFSGDVGVGIPLHFKSVVQQPGLGIVVVNSADFIAEATPAFTFYGASHTYQLGNNAGSQIGITTGNGATTSRANTRVGIRYE